MGEQKFGIDHAACQQIAQAIKEVHALGVQMGIVVGGGNIFRGNQAEAFGFARTPADHIGMLATTINGLVLQQTLASLGVESRVMSALNTDSIVETYHWGHALAFLAKRDDRHFCRRNRQSLLHHRFRRSSARQRDPSRNSIQSDKGRGIYSEDPKKNPKAVKIRPPHLFRSSREKIKCHGCDSDCALPRKPDSDLRI